MRWSTRTRETEKETVPESRGGPFTMGSNDPTLAVAEAGVLFFASSPFVITDKGVGESWTPLLKFFTE